jgi:hypothetical protein
LFRTVVLVLGVAGLWIQAAHAQAVRARSGDYLFAASASDARALWVNPAGLAASFEASVLAEFAVERPIAGDLRLAQWSLGLNSRGLSLGYQRDRFQGSLSTSALRFGLALPFPKGAIGAAITLYKGNLVDSTTDRGIDLGARYRIVRPLELGMVLRNIGRPVLLDAPGPLTAVASAAWHLLPNRVVVAGEAIVAERLGASGYDTSYRGGLQATIQWSVPITVVGAIDLGESLALDQWLVGIAIGSQDRVMTAASGGAFGPNDRLERLSVTGMASRQLGIP